MRRYNVIGNVVRAVDFVSRVASLAYDDIVDRSNWSLSSEKDMARVAKNGASSGFSGSYDDPEHLPSDLEVKIRSGKLDKAEVSRVVEQHLVDSAKENNEKKKKSELEKAKKIAEARQDYLDKATGFTGMPQDD